MLAHDVFFTLFDPSPKAIDDMVAACTSTSRTIPAWSSSRRGKCGEEFNRPVNDRMYHVALHVYFKDKEAHDVYQTAPDHMKFIDENKSKWKQVRVFDSWVTK